MANKINFQIGYTVDKTGLNEVQSALKQVQIEANKALNAGNLDTGLKNAAKSAQQLQTILNDSWNGKLNQLDLSKLNNSIKTSFGSVEQLRKSFILTGKSASDGGQAAAAAYNKFASQVLNTNLQLKQSNKLLDDMATTMSNTVKWGITSSIFNNITNSISQAYNYTKNLDSSLNDIRIVTDKSADSMIKFAKEANSAAKALGSSTLNYTQSSLIYYQQGLSDEEAKARTETTLKAANVTGQTGEEVSEQLTAVWNGYKVTAEETELYVDKLAAVAASTASDLEELSTGMSKVASAASAMGVDIDQLNGMLSTVISVTRQAPESAGTAFKTIFARMEDLELNGEDEFGVSLGEVSSSLESMGVHILDSEGSMRELGEVIEEVGNKWNSGAWSDAEKQALAIDLAGKRQYNNLLALFDNWNMYNEAVNTSIDSVGTLQHQQDIYMESTEAHLQQLRTEADKTYDILFNQDAVNSLADATTGALSIFNDYLTGLNGGLNSIIHMGSVIANIFSNQIGKSINQSLTNLDAYRTSKDAGALKQQIINNDAIRGIHTNLDNNENPVNEVDAARLEAEMAVQQKILNIKDALTEDEYNQLTAHQQRMGELAGEIANIESYKKISEEILDNENATSAEYQERIGYEKEFLKSAEEQEQVLIRASRLYNYLADVDKEGSGEEERIQLYEALSDLDMDMLKTEEARTAVVDLMDDLDNNRIINADKLKLILKEQKDTVLTQSDLVKRLTEAAQHRQQAEDGTLDKLRQEEEARQKIIDQTTEQAERQQLLSQAVSGLMTVISLFTTLSGIMQTLNNEDLTAGEKIQAVVTTLLATLPMLIMNFSSISAILPGLATGISTLALSLAATTGAELTTTVATTSLTKAVIMLWGALGPYLPIIAAVAAAIGALVGVIYLAVKAYNADADAAKAAAEASKEAAEAAKEAKEAYEELAKAFDAYDTAVEKLKELKTGTEEWSKALGEANSAAMDLIKSNQSLAKYATRNAQGLIEFRDENGEKLDTQTLINEAKTRMNTAQAAANLAQVDANNKSLKSQRTNLAREENIGYTTYTDDGAEAFIQISDEQFQDVINTINEHEGTLLKEDLEKLASLNKNKELIDSIIDAKDRVIDLAKTTKDLNATNKLLVDESLRSELENDETYAKMNDSEKNAVASIYGEGLTEEKQDEIRQKLHDTWYKDKAAGDGNEDLVHARYAEIKGWTKTDDHWGDTADFVDAEGNEHKGITDDSMRAYIVNYELSEELAKYDPENLKNIQAAVKGISKTGSKFNENVSSEMLGFASQKDMDFDETKITTAMRTEILQSIESGEFLDSLSGITKEQWKAIGYKDAEEYKNAIETGLNEENFDIEKSRKESVKRLGGVADDASKVYEGIQTGEITKENAAENESYKKLIDQLGELKTTYPEVTAAAEVLNKEWLIGTQEYSEALSQVQDALYKAKIESLTDDADDKIDELSKYLNETDFKGNLVLDDAEFQKKMDEVLNAEYQIDVAIHAEAEQEFNDISNALTDISDKAALIGEKFVVSANDVRELNNTFPGIIQNMKDLGDGTVQLNQEVVQSAIGMAQAEVAADSEATINKLQNQAILLRQKQTAYQNMANAAMVLAQSETQSDETAASQRLIINENLTALKGLNKEIETQNEMDNDKAVADSANVNGEIAAKNWASAYQSAANSSYQFAQTAVANMKAAAGDGKPQKPGDFGVKYSGSSGESSEAKALEGTQSALDKGIETSAADWEKLAQQYQMLADNAGAAANDIDGMVAQIGATGVELKHSFGNIASGKGSGDKEKDSDLMEYLEEETDRYHDINLEIEKLESNLDRVSKQQEKLYSKDLINNLNKQLDILEKQKKVYEEKLNIAKAESQELKGMLSMQGVAFDAEGYIANYTPALQAKLNYVNSLIAQYNAMSAEEQEGFKETIEVAKQDYETFKSQMERYDELVSSFIPEIEDSIQDAVDKEIEINIKKFNMEIELKLDTAQAERDFNEFKRKVIDGIKDDDIIGNAIFKLKDYTSYFNTNNSGIGPIQEATNKVNDIIKEIKLINSSGWSNVYGNNKALAIEDLEKYYGELTEQLGNVVDLVDEIKESYLDMIDEAVEAFDKQVDQYEYINDLLNHDINVVKLLYGEEAYTEMARYYDQIEKNNKQELDFLKQRVIYTENMMNRETDPEARKKWEEEWMEALNKLNSKVEDSIQNIIDKYQNAINKTFDELNKEITNGKGLDYVSDEWDLINKNADQYLDTVNSIYAVQSLENKYLEALDQTDSLHAQQKLNDMMNDQLDMLKNKDKLTQYDIDRANKMYEITLKQIALEEAQQNKSKMRLRRDSQGNYSYQFVSDEDSIAQAQQELLAAQNDLYNLDKDKYKENLNQIYDYYVEFQEKYKEIMLDMSLTDEERQERTKLLQEQYGELINGLVEQNETIKQNLQESTFEALEGLYETDADSFEEMTGKNIEAFRNFTDTEKNLFMNELEPQWTSTVQKMADKFAKDGGLIPTCQEAFERLDNTTKEYESSLNVLAETAGVNFNFIKGGYDVNIEKAQDLLYANNELINKYSEEISKISEVVSSLGNLEFGYKKVKNAAIEAANAAYSFLQAQSQAAAVPAPKNNSNISFSGGSFGSGYTNTNKSNTNNGSGKGSSGTPPVSSPPSSPAVPTKKKKHGYVIKSGLDSTILASRDDYSDYSSARVAGLYKVQQLNKSARMLAPYLASTYDTGGYTGEWNSQDGKLAILHQKELVLNAQDTKNILTTVGIVRDITGLLDNVQSNMMNKIVGLSSRFNAPMSDISATSNTLEQNVYIEASFPNVQNSREIEDAFNNLVNIASQRAYRTQR